MCYTTLNIPYESINNIIKWLNDKNIEYKYDLYCVENPDNTHNNYEYYHRNIWYFKSEDNRALFSLTWDNR